jgi:VanZ family protein
VLKKGIFLITILYTLALLVVCLYPFKKLPDVGVSYADKLFHSFTYIILSFLWFETLVLYFKIDKIKAILYASIIAIIFGIIIEVLQGALTASRQADINDVLANSSGVVFTASVLWLKNRIIVKKL